MPGAGKCRDSIQANYIFLKCNIKSPPRKIFYLLVQEYKVQTCLLASLFYCKRFTKKFIESITRKTKTTHICQTYLHQNKLMFSFYLPCIKSLCRLNIYVWWEWLFPQCIALCFWDHRTFHIFVLLNENEELEGNMSNAKTFFLFPQ